MKSQGSQGNLILWTPTKLLVQVSIFIKSNQFATLDFSMKTLPSPPSAASLTLISAAHSSYTVVVSSRTHSDTGSLCRGPVEKHGAQVVDYTSVNESRLSTQAVSETYLFVAQPDEVGQEVHRRGTSAYS